MTATRLAATAFTTVTAALLLVGTLAPAHLAATRAVAPQGRVVA